MQRLTVIIGKKEEGKSIDLFLEYISHFIGEYVGDNKEPARLNDSLRPVFIIGDSNSIDANVEFRKLQDLLFEEDFDTWQWEAIKTETHIIYSVSNKNDIENIIKDELEEMDCIVYLDDCDELITVEQAVNWISEYSCQDGYNNLDIVMTKQF